jgi:two-component system sensor histidine kinase DesK
VLSAYAGGSFADGFDGAVFTAVAALAVFGLAWFARMAAEQADSRRALAERIVARERLRFSRDTHDLLGLSLSAITLKGELVRRLVTADPAQAEAELGELLVMSRRALADVRAITAGSRELCLAEECHSAVSVLRAAGVDVRFDGDVPAHLPPAVATTFATVLRESLTNVVRHSKATWCSFSVRASGGTAWLRVDNDGVAAGGAAEPDARPDGGAGLRNLGYRIGALGGELTAGVHGDGTHRLCATVPLQSLPDRAGRARARRRVG